jgi:putative transposase
MEISVSTYNYDPKKSRAQKEEEDADLRGKIEQVKAEFPRTGYRMLLHHLKRKGISFGEAKLRRIIKQFDLQFKHKRKFIATTDSNHDCLVHPNLIQGMTIDNINQVWTADITYIRIANGFIYLAVILDLYSRKIIGHAISKKIDGALAVDALNMAIKRLTPPRGVIHHSDRGVQYLCNDYIDILSDKGFHFSSSRKGNPYDNAWTESLMIDFEVR